MIDDDDLDALSERAWDDGYRAALRVLHEADEATAPHRAVALYGLPVTDPTDSQFPETCRSAVW